MTQRVWF